MCYVRFRDIKYSINEMSIPQEGGFLSIHDDKTDEFEI